MPPAAYLHEPFQIVRIGGAWLALATLLWFPTASCEAGEVGDLTSESVDASSYDERPLLEGGCYVDGCEPDLTCDRLGTDVTQSQWSCEATGTEACYTSPTLSERPGRLIASTCIVQLVRQVRYSSRTPYLFLNENSRAKNWRCFCSQSPTATAVSIEADFPPENGSAIRETIYVTLDEDGGLADDDASSDSEALIGFIVSTISLCCCGCCIYRRQLLLVHGVGLFLQP
ncbi:unnamed protein product [Ectocarpus sp. 8 AP-2014]